MPQPDNAEEVLQLERGEEEACLLIGRDRWQIDREVSQASPIVSVSHETSLSISWDRWELGVWWDDAACYTKEEFICEDSTELLTRAGINKPVVFG